MPPLCRSDLLALPACDEDKAFAMVIAHEETVVTPGLTFLQCALLHTSSSGERRIRVHTMAVPVVTELHEMYRATDGGAMAAMCSKLAAERVYNGRLEEARQSLQAKVFATLKEYRLLHASSARAYNRLVFPDSMRLLPLYTLATAKAAALRGGFKDVPSDVRAMSAFDLIAMPISRLLRYLYPVAYAVHLAPPPGGGPAPPPLPPLIPLCGDRVDARGAYLVDNAVELLLWLGAQMPTDLVEGLIGLPAVPPDAARVLAGLAPQPAPASQALWALISQLRAASPVFLPLRVCAQGQASEVRPGAAPVACY